MMQNESDCNYFLAKLYLSFFCLIIYVLICLCCCVLIVFAIIAGDKWIDDKRIIILEIVINVFLIIDIFLRMKLLSLKVFFQSYSNILDIFLLVFILIAFSAYHIVESTENIKLANIIENILYIVWFLWQLKRMYSLIQQASKTGEISGGYLDIDDIEDLAISEDPMSCWNSVI